MWVGLGLQGLGVLVDYVGCIVLVLLVQLLLVLLVLLLLLVCLAGVWAVCVCNAGVMVQGQTPGV